MTYSHGTTYRGVRYASRLEARYAANLVALGLAPEYEPDRPFGLMVVTTADGRRERYLRDFVLAGQNAITLEVKGDHNERVHKPKAFAQEHPDEVILLGHEHGPGDDPDAPPPMVRVTRRGNHRGEPWGIAHCATCDRATLGPNAAIRTGRLACVGCAATGLDPVAVWLPTPADEQPDLERLTPWQLRRDPYDLGRLSPDECRALVEAYRVGEPTGRPGALVAAPGGGLLEAVEPLEDDYDPTASWSAMFGRPVEPVAEVVEPVRPADEPLERARLRPYSPAWDEARRRCPGCGRVAPDPMLLPGEILIDAARSGQAEACGCGGWLPVPRVVRVGRVCLAECRCARCVPARGLYARLDAQRAALPAPEVARVSAPAQVAVKQAPTPRRAPASPRQPIAIVAPTWIRRVVAWWDRRRSS